MHLQSWAARARRTKYAALPVVVTPGVWYDVTPAGISLDPDYGGAPGSGGNFGFESVWHDSSNVGTFYAMCHLQGVWKSTDGGVTWTGPINTGTNGAAITASAGCVTGAATGGIPVLYVNVGRGNLGFYKSTDGGVNWSTTDLSPPLPDGREDIYPESVNPYNKDHVLTTAHENNYIIHSTDGGATWSNVTMPISPSGGSCYIFYIDTGNATTTADTWLLIAQASSVDGTWRTTNAGASWTKVDGNEHTHGGCQIAQLGGGVIWMTGVYSSLGWGCLRSTDYGATWTHYGPNEGRSVIWGTSKKIYAMGGGAVQTPVDPGFISAVAPGTGTWSAESGAAATYNGGAQMLDQYFNGTNNVFIMAMGNSGLQRYVEP